MIVNPTRIKAELARADGLYRQGKGREAAPILRALIATKPDLAPAHFLLGRILCDAGQATAALDPLGQALRLAPKQTIIWEAMLQALGDGGTPDARTAFIAQVQQAPLPAATRDALLEKARRTAVVALNGAPKAEVDGLIRSVMARDPAALPCAQALHARFPDVSIVTSLLASAFAIVGAETDAIRMFRHAIAQDPLSPQIRLNFGRHLLEFDMPQSAVRQFERACVLWPDSGEAQFLLASALRDAGQTGKMLDPALRAVTLLPANPAMLCLLGDARLAQDDIEGAETIARGLTCDHPDLADGWMLRGRIDNIRGRRADAVDAFRRAIDLAPHAPAAYRALSRAHKFDGNDPLLARMETLYADPTTTLDGQIQLGFALAKAMEDTQQHARVFTYLRPANDALAAQMPFDIDAHRRLLDDMKRLADRLDLPAIAAASPHDFDPILVTGMPRSGTTLVEQILASHPAVTGVGEAEWQAEAFLGERNGRPIHSLFPDAAAIHAAGGRYAALARAETGTETGGTTRIADKALWTFFYLGLVAASLPRARILVLDRDPRDTLLSMYKNQFRKTAHVYNTNLRALAAVYAGFQDMIGFWSDRLPGRITRVRYDHLTAAPEANIRAMLDQCGLPFDAATLTPHQTERDVRTLSITQVRQPIYQSSVRAWERYRDDLAPLLAALDEFGVAPSRWDN